MSDAAQYAIEIAARMTGGEYTTAQLDELTATLNGAGKGAAHFQEAIQRASGELATAAAENVTAQKALADGATVYGQLERAAVNAAKAAERAALKNAGAVPAELAAKAAAATAALADQAAVMKGLEAAAAATDRKETGLSRTLDNIKKLSGHVDKSLAGQSEQLAKVQGALNATGSPVGMLTARVLGLRKGFTDMSQVLGKSKAAALVAGIGIAALAVGAAIATAALVKGALAIGAWAIALADSQRTTVLTISAYEAIGSSMAKLQGQVIDLNRNLGLGEDTLNGLVGALKSAHVSAKDMSIALDAAAVAELALGKGGAQQFIDQIAAGKITVDEFAATVSSKLGGIARKQLLSLGNQSVRFKALFQDTFGSLDVDPALAGLQRLVNLFDSSTASGSAMQTIFTGIFQPLIDSTDNASVTIEAFVLGVEIGLTKLYIKAKPAIHALQDLFGFDTSAVSGWTEAGESFAKVLVVVGVAIGGVVALGLVLLGAITAVIGVVGLAVAAILGLGFAIGYGLAWAWSAFTGALQTVGEAIGNFVYNAVQCFVGMGQKVTAWFASFSLVDMGRNMILGLVSGITGAAGAVVDAISGAVTGAITKAKSLLGIHSPSKVFAEIGDFTGQGFVEGVADQQGPANDVMASLVEPPPEALSAQDSLSGNFGPVVPAQVPAQAVAPEAKGGGDRPSVTGNTYNFYGVEGAEDAEARFSELLTKYIEGDAITAGGGAKAA